MAIERFEFHKQQWTRIPAKTFERWIVGVDIGQSQDPTAISIMRHHCAPTDHWNVDKVKCTTRQEADEFCDVVHVERVALKTDYGAVADRVREILDRDPLRRAEHLDLVLDDTGVGRAVGDDMVKRLGLNPYRVTITAGDTQTRVTGKSWNVSKSILISTVDAMLNSGELRFAPELLEAPTLKEELANFQRTVTGSGRAQYAARTGAHDDIVLAVALCCWRARGGGGRGEVYSGTVRGMY